jgi:hypothetical protein
LTVSLSSGKPSVAAVPASFVIPAGASNATFHIQTASVQVRTDVQIAVSANGGSRGATLTVAP